MASYPYDTHTKHTISIHRYPHYHHHHRHDHHLSHHQSIANTNLHDFIPYRKPSYNKAIFQWFMADFPLLKSYIYIHSGVCFCAKFYQPNIFWINSSGGSWVYNTNKQRAHILLYSLQEWQKNHIVVGVVSVWVFFFLFVTLCFAPQKKPLPIFVENA